ncbi:uncharacterized protein CANTADRAFT_323180 [Suhomyces tanzawaensis NRRL Y-17324]|uniref:Uncharacterized protein n=1 Tax=Suhomyces tanzawaensis NRRL Y-17324 TaxID=984487 RepID=A0A1E4SBZ9_9ASCO|nr:uncharacterized protein CANTADRAFT_323180 [Suhomyces tanzawaensis NRRL Y-17324]ODV77029.1 hypothetical protein CANTADRAFT_323180 [Suhomyces tanzawaensis NRRL Y-17324]
MRGQLDFFHGRKWGSLAREEVGRVVVSTGRCALRLRGAEGGSDGARGGRPGVPWRQERLGRLVKAGPIGHASGTTPWQLFAHIPEKMIGWQSRSEHPGTPKIWQKELDGAGSTLDS